MNYMRLIDNDLVNGAGIRVSLFVSGCTHNCVGCYNPESHNFLSGNKYTGETKEAILQMLSKPHITGLSLTGGDPLMVANRGEILQLCQLAKSQYPEKDIWIWTGYEWDDIKTLTLLEHVDVVICGKFQQDNKIVGKSYGSSNQYMVDVASSLRQQSIVIVN